MPADKPREVEPPGGDRPASAGAPDEGLPPPLRRGVKAASARWAVRRRGEPEIWPRPQDEAPHPWVGRRHFPEDYTFAAVQPVLALIARGGWLTGRLAHRLWL